MKDIKEKKAGFSTCLSLSQMRFEIFDLL